MFKIAFLSRNLYQNMVKIRKKNVLKITVSLMLHSHWLPAARALPQTLCC